MIICNQVKLCPGASAFYICSYETYEIYKQGHNLFVHKFFCARVLVRIPKAVLTQTVSKDIQRFPL